MTKGLTEIQQEHNALLRVFRESDAFKQFVIEGYKYLANLFDMYRIPPKKSKCNWCVLCSKMHDYLTLSNFDNKCMAAFNSTQLLSNQKAICTKIYMDLLGKIAEDEASRV